jgi:hypothetical protein
VDIKSRKGISLDRIFSESSTEIRADFGCFFPAQNYYVSKYKIVTKIKTFKKDRNGL